MFTLAQIIQIIAYLFPNPFPPACNPGPGIGCLPIAGIGQ